MARNRRRSDPTGSYIERVEESDAYENIAGMIPGIGTAITISDIEDELNKEEPDYLKIGMLAGTEAIGLVPGLGAAAKSMIRKGADMARQMDNVIEVPSNIPQVSRSTTPSYTDAALLEADDIIFEWGKGNLTNPQLRNLMREKGFEIQTKNISPKMTGDDLEVVGPDGNILRWKDMPRGKAGPSLADREADALEAARLRNDPEALEQWRKENKLPESQRQKNLPDAEAAAQALIEGSITSKEARKRIQEAFPEPREYTAEEAMNLLPTLTEVQGALGKKGTRYPILGVDGADLAEGQVVSSRLDIPAYDDYDKWVVSIHDGNQKSGSVVGYGQAIRLKNIKFGSDADTALDIARGIRTSRATGQDAIDKKTGEAAKQNKATIARIFGEYTSEDPYDLQRQAAEIIASGSDEWTQVGMNPYRGSAFYDKKTGMPVFEAEEVIQVGPLVLAKNVKKPTISQMKEMAVRTRDNKLRMFNEGGIAMDEQMNAVFKSRRGYAEGGNTEVDPVSGNDVPPGSLPEEVRDDIPAQLSEGEYVVPADVVRYYGVKFFEDLRMQAKMGFAEMDAQGRIGGEPLDGMEIVEPEDDLPFDLDDLEVVEVIEMDEGGDVARRGMITSGDPDSPGGALGLGQEGLSLSSKSSVEMKKYVNEDGHALMILFINGDPITPIPEGYYLEEEGVEEAVDETTEEEVTQATDDGSTTSTATDMPEAIKYDQLTIDDMKSMVEDQGSVKGNMIAIAFGTMNPVMGLGVKLALRDQQRKLENEMKRRLAASDITAQERTEIEALLKATQEEKPNFLKQLFGDLTGKSYTPEVTAAEVTLPTTAAPEGLLDLPLDEMSKQLAPPEGFAIEEYQRAQERKSRKKREEMAAAKADSATYSDSGTESVIQSMKDRGASEAAIKEAEEEAEKVKSSISNIQKGVQVGFKKGGLASKKKK
jgi:hypothetical protein